jgi:predicted DNA-binding protein
MVKIPTVMRGKQVQLTMSLPPELVRGLKLLSEGTRVPMAAYMREALEDLLKKHAAVLRRVR